MRKTLGGASGVVMVAAVNGVVAGGPWIVVITVVGAVGGALAVWFSLLAFVDKLAFCKQGDEPTRRVIAIIRAVKSPSSPPGRRNRTRAKPPGSRSLGAGYGQLCWPSPCTPDPSPRGWCRSGHRPHPPWSVATPRTGRPCLITAGARSVPPGPRGRAGKWSCPLGRRRQRRAHAGLRRPGTRSAAR